jgi:hypothetical protein
MTSSEKWWRSKFRISGPYPSIIKPGSTALVFNIVAIFTCLAHQQRYVKNVQATKAAIPISSSDVARPRSALENIGL